MPNFKIFSSEEKQIIQHLAFPKFTATISFNSLESDIEDIKMIDCCDNAMLMAKTMKEAGEFIFNYKKSIVPESV